MNINYPVVRGPDIIPVSFDWRSPLWLSVAFVEIFHYRPESSEHRPETRIKLQYNSTGIYGIFKVNDRYIRSVHVDHNSSVCKDSCVEFFIKPFGCKGYFNFEFNCGGTMHCSYITDWTRTSDGFAESILIPEQECRKISISTSMPKVVEPEIQEPLVWFAGFGIPFSLMAKYADFKIPEAGDKWKANFYKCGDATSHPHWGAWSPVSELNFHMPECFGVIQFK